MDNTSDKQIAEQLRQEFRQDEVKKTNFPTEVIELPSRGLLYPEGHVLATGVIEMKYMTAKEEDILTSANLIKQGVVLDKLLKSLIVTPVNYNDILIGDKNAIMVAARVLGYGKDYNAELKCPNCDAKNEINIDLTTIENKEIDLNKITKGTTEFHFSLPSSKRDVTFKVLTHGDDRAIEQEIKSLKKTTKRSGIDPTLSTRLAYTITSIDGNRDRKVVRDFVENELFAIDSRALRTYALDVTPDIDMSFYFECDSCSHENDSMPVPMTIDFFWPRA